MQVHNSEKQSLSLVKKNCILEEQSHNYLYYLFIPWQKRASRYISFSVAQSSGFFHIFIIFFQCGMIITDSERVIHSSPAVFLLSTL